jgi:hypothetical protein
MTASGSDAGRALPCRRCGHLNVLPVAITISRAKTAPSAADPASRRGIRVGLASTLVAVSVWAVAVKFDMWGAGASAPAVTTAEVMQQELLRESIRKPGDPILNRMYLEISARHFEAQLPPMEVMWEPRLADVGKLSPRQFTLQGMFGQIGRHAVILLNPGLQEDPAAVARTLSHEIVHAYLSAAGAKDAGHGPDFQQLLQRLASEGAFEGVVATDEERESLRTWLDAEAARLDVERSEMTRLASDLERERGDVEHGFNGNAATFVQRRNAYNQRAVEANERADRARASVEYFNRQVDRYNLMLVYPDGLDARALIEPRTTGR